MPPKIQHLFVDEAGTPTLFHSKGKSIVDTPGCSRFFLLGKLDVEEPDDLVTGLTDLRQKLMGDPYFGGIESFRPERRKTALAFHAKDDLPEVRYAVFDLLRQFGERLRFHAVVCDKLQLLRSETEKRAQDPGYRFRENSIYDHLVRELFGKLHRLADHYEVCVARRGNRDRTQAIKAALEHAEQDFEENFGFRRVAPDAWTIRVSTPRQTACLQAVDCFLWAVQRFYESKWDAQTSQKRLDKDGQEVREARYLQALWPQIGEIHDLDFGPRGGTFFMAGNPLTLEARFGHPKST